MKYIVTLEFDCPSEHRARNLMQAALGVAYKLAVAVVKWRLVAATEDELRVVAEGGE